MHTLYRHSLLLFLLLSTAAVVRAQTQAEWIKAAETSFEYGDYYSAAYYYEEALDYDSTDHELRFRMGESHLLYRNYETALEAFDQLEAKGVAANFPRLPYLQAKAQQPLGHYDEAIANFNEFLAAPGNGSAQEVADARRQISNSEWAKEEYAAYEEELANGTQADIFPINYTNVNTKFDDFAPQFEADQFYFSSLRFKMEADSVKPARKVARILQRKADGGELTTNKLLPPEINQRNRTAAHTAFNADASMVYFTYCEYRQDTFSLRCDLYAAPVDAEGKWGTPQMLPINDGMANNTEPSVGVHPDGRTYLYFASDRSGGKGKHDLYRAEILEEGFGSVEALDELNTPFEEVTPFYYAPKRELYFSTDGRNTLGGMDVYRSTMAFNGEAWFEPVHLGLPTNSSYNDVYYVRYEDHDFGYFASNRHAADAIFWDEDEDVCCNDIYMVEIEKLCYEVTTWHAQTQEELHATTVTFYEELPGGERIELAQEMDPAGNFYTFEVEKGRNYHVTGYKRGFKSDEASVDISQWFRDLAEKPEKIGKCIKSELFLAPPKIILEVTTFNKRDSTELPGCTVYLFSRQKDSDPLVEIGRDTKEDSNFYSYEIYAEHYYQIIGTKPEHSSDSASVDTRGLFVENDTVIKRQLYLEPFLPDPCDIQPTVFFHNDRPRKGNPHTITSADYMDTYNTYVNTHKPNYYRIWAKAPGENTTVRTARLDAYFGEVDKGAEDLRAFAEMLHGYLQKGGALKVNLQGFASPLSNGPYNDKLSARRCISVINYLWNYEGGVLRQYMSDGVILINNKAGEEAQGRGIRRHAVPSSYKGMPVVAYQSDAAPAQSGKALVFDIKPGGEVPVNPAAGLVDTGSDSVYSPVAGAARYVEVKVELCDEEQTDETDY
ncbi:MAG: hypothetical protein D6772_03635 [Bacteroidetes bacterium]|nr:MAG: hypothetical protein D6772_03635 [Bacteroidota bacterium]